MIGMFTTSCKERSLPFVGNETRKCLPDISCVQSQGIKGAPFSNALNLRVSGLHKVKKATCGAICIYI